jgi:hypothetical protein
MLSRSKDDSFLNGIVPYIESLPGVHSVKVIKRSGISSAQLVLLQDRFGALPKDYSSFLKFCDGFQISWSCCLHGANQDMGLLEIESSRAILEWNGILTPPMLLNHQPILIQKCESFGFAALFLSKEESPVYFYNEQAREWILLANSFLSYTRLMISCLGIFGWQLGYAKDRHKAWPVWTMNWMYFYAPEMASIIIKSRHLDMKQIQNDSEDENKFDLEKCGKLINQWKDSTKEYSNPTDIMQKMRAARESL